MGQSCRADDVQIRRKQTPSLQNHKSIVWKRLKLFFAQLFLLISSVFTGHSQICVTNANPAMLEQDDLFLVGQSDPKFVPTSVMKTHLHF